MYGESNTNQQETRHSQWPVIAYTRIDQLSDQLNLNLKFYLAYIQHNTTDTEHMLIMNARKPVITKIVDATGRPLKLQNTVYL